MTHEKHLDFETNDYECTVFGQVLFHRPLRAGSLQAETIRGDKN